MTSDAEFSSSDLDDLLNQADDLDADEIQQTSRNQASAASGPRRGLFSGRNSASQNATGNSNRSAMLQERRTAQESGKSELAEEIPVQRLSKTPPKPVESPPELRPVIEGTPLPENPRFLKLACACGNRMRIKAQNAGKTVKCPKCESPLRVPATAATAGVTIKFQLEDSFTSKLSKVIAQFDRDAERLAENKTLSRFAFRSVRLSVESISGGRFDTERVREALRDLGESEDSRGFALLREAWEAEPGNLQSDILNALGRSKDPRAIAFLLQLLTHHSPETRMYVVQSLALTGDPRIIPVLLYYGQRQLNQKYIVSESLLKMGDSIVTPLLELLSATQDRELLTDLAIILGRLKSPDAIRPLVRLLDTDDCSLQGYVAEALGAIGDPKSMTSLLPLLQSENEKLRIQAAGALGRVPHPGCLKALIESLNDENVEVRKHCAAALGELGDNRAAAALVPLLKEPNTELRIAAAEALGHVGDQRAVPYLLNMIEDEEDSVILKALGALRKIKDPATASALMGLLHHESSRIRQRTCDVLGLVGDAVVAERLEPVLKNDRSEEVRASAAKALGEIRDPGSVDTLIDALHDAFSVRCRAVVALGELGDEGALPSLLAMLKDPAPEIRYHAAQALAEMKHQPSVKQIHPLLDDSNAMVRRGAAKALETLGQGDAEKLLGSSTQQGLRRVLKRLKSMVVNLAPGAIADAIQHDTRKTIAALAGVVLIPLLCAAGYYLIGRSQQTAETVALLRRGNVSSIDISADGATIVVGRTTGVVEIWDLKGQKRSKIFAPDGLSGEITGASRVPGTQQLVLCSNATAGGFDSRSGKMLWQISGHSGAIRRFIASRDRQYVMVGSSDGVFSFWDAKTGNPIGAGAVQLPQDKTQETELSNNGRMIAGVGAQGPVTVWSTETAEQLSLFDDFADSTIIDMEFSTDDQSLAMSDALGRVAVIDLNTRRIRQQVKDPLLTPQGFPKLFDKLTFNSEGTQLRGFLGSNKLFSMDLKTGEIVETEVQTPLVLSAFGNQPDGPLFAIGKDDESPVYVFDRKDGRRKAVLDAD